MKKKIFRILALALVVFSLNLTVAPTAETYAYSSFSATGKSSGMYSYGGSSSNYCLITNVRNRVVNFNLTVGRGSSWHHVELLDKNKVPVWDIWCNPFDHCSFRCGSNIYYIRVTNSSASYLTFTGSNMT